MPIWKPLRPPTQSSMHTSLKRPIRHAPWPKPAMKNSRQARAARWKAFRSGSRTCSRPRAFTQAASGILHDFKPRYESTVTQNLWDDGAVMLGKLNMDEFAMGSSNETSAYGPVVNPWRSTGSNADLVPGGSSGGSAAAVAAWLCAGATATDTGGSIRQPAALTGTVGVKPTYGRCSRWGVVAFASSLDQAGPITRDVRDAAILLKSMASVDTKDTTSVDLPVPDYETAIGESIKGKVIGIPKEYRMDGMPDEIEELWQTGIAWMRDAGAEIRDISLPHTKYALLPTISWPPPKRRPIGALRRRSLWQTRTWIGYRRAL